MKRLSVVFRLARFYVLGNLTKYAQLQEKIKKTYYTLQDTLEIMFFNFAFFIVKLVGNNRFCSLKGDWGIFLFNRTLMPVYGMGLSILDV